MVWDTPMDRMLRERAAKYREKAAKARKIEEMRQSRDEPENRSEPIIILPNPPQL